MRRSLRRLILRISLFQNSRFVLIEKHKMPVKGKRKWRIRPRIWDIDQHLVLQSFLSLFWSFSSMKKAIPAKTSTKRIIKKGKKSIVVLTAEDVPPIMKDIARNAKSARGCEIRPYQESLSQIHWWIKLLRDNDVQAPIANVGSFSLERVALPFWTRLISQKSSVFTRHGWKVGR